MVWVLHQIRKNEWLESCKPHQTLMPGHFHLIRSRRIKEQSAINIEHKQVVATGERVKGWVK